MARFFRPVLLILWTFLVSELNAQPAIIGPSNGSSTWNQIYFDWSEIPGASYEFQIDTVNTFTSPVLFDVVTTNHEYLKQGFFFGQGYYWRVRTVTGGNNSPWSPITTFLTGDVVEILSPAAGSIGPVKMTLDWATHPGVAVYDVQLDTSSSFTSPVLISVVDTNYLNIEGFTDTEEDFSQLKYGQTYYWRVRARHSFDQTPWAVGSFQTQTQCGITAPANGSQTFSGVLLNWTSIDGSQFFDVQVDTVSSFNSAVVQSFVDTFIQPGNANSDSEEWVDGLFFGTDYFWRVRARHAQDTSNWTTGYFSTAGAPVLAAPANLTNQFTQVLLNWNAFAGVSFYDWELDAVNSFGSPALRTGSTVYQTPVSTNPDTEVLVENLDFGQDYFWRVRARTLADTSGWSGVFSFHTNGSTSTLEPTGGQTDFTGVFLRSQPQPGVSSYMVQIDTSLTFLSPAVVVAQAASDTVYVDGLQFGAGYHWKVAMVNANDTSAWSASSFFYTYDYPGLLSPAQGALSQPLTGVNLDWLAHRGATWYVIQIDTINSFDSPFLIQDSLPYINAESGNADTHYFLGPLLSNQVYFWRVKVLNAHDQSLWEQRWFTTSSTAPLFPPAPVLIYPIANSVDLPVSVTLDWMDVVGANGYQYQISDQPDLAAAPIQFTPFSSATVSLAYATTYHWRARTLKNNLYSDWTVPYAFTTALPVLNAPVLLSPPDLSVGNPVNGLLLQWQLVPNAETYWVQVASDPNFFFDLQEDTVAFPYFTVAGLEAGATYYWRVLAMNSTMTQSGWSPIWAFTTAQMIGTPVLISPPNLATNQDYESLGFSWNMVPGADLYQLELSLTDNFTGGVSQEEVGSPMLVMANLLPDTLYYWRVKASAAGMLPGNWSIPWQFHTRPGQNGWAGPEGLGAAWDLFPNPATDVLTIRLPMEWSTDYLLISDLTGRVLLKNPTRGLSMVMVPLDGLSSGLYLVELAGDGLRSTKKVVIRN